MSTGEHIHPIFDQLLQRRDKEDLLKQRAVVLWLTGLSGSGKSTIAKGLEKRLHQDGFFTQVLDGDNIRSGISNNLSFSPEDRQENIRRISEVAKLFLDAGTVTICSFVSPTEAIRQVAADIIGEQFHEVYINAPLSVCEDRDVKGLYQKARAGEIKQFTGIDAPFEAPPSPAYEIRTHETTIEEGVEGLYQFVKPLISWKV